MVIYTNGSILQTFPVPEGPEWRVATEDDVAAAESAMAFRVACAAEDEWTATEMVAVAGQLLMLEDEDPSALPGTAREWRDYRIALRAWKEGAEGFPISEQRPVRPA